MNKQADIAQMIKSLRRLLGMTQEQFAAKLGVTFPTVNRWENSKTKPSPLALQKLQKLQKDVNKVDSQEKNKIPGDLTL